MKIVILDGHTANPGDLDWEGLGPLGEVTVYDRTAAAEVVGRAAGADAVLTNKVPITGEMLRSLPDLRYIGVLATGYNVVDTGAAMRSGVTVTNVPAYSTPSVVQLTFALILELAHRPAAHDAAVKEGRWATSSDFSFTVAPLTELAGLKLGLVGFGDIGRAVSRVGLAFDMEVLVHTRTVPEGLQNVRFVGRETLFAESDIVSLHCPLTPETKHLINAETLCAMKNSAFLINTGRGDLIDEAALAAALEEGGIAGAGLDVLSTEPPAPDNPLPGAPHSVVTPHIAWATQASRRRLIATACANLRAFAKGDPVNVVT